MSEYRELRRVRPPLPFDVICRILQLGDIPSYPQDVPRICNLLLVSRLWNEAARSTAELWTKVCLHPGNFNKAEAGSLARWLERSLNQPMHVRLYLDDARCGD